MSWESMFQGRTVAGAKWTRNSDESQESTGRSVTIQFKPIGDCKEEDSDASKNNVQDLQAALYAGLAEDRCKMLMRSEAVRIERSLNRLVDSAAIKPKVSRPLSKDGKYEYVLAYDVYMTGKGGNDSALHSVKILSACARALANARVSASRTSSCMPNFRSVIVIHADEPKGAPALTSSTIKYIYEQFSEKTKGPNLAAVYVLTESLATQALIGFTSMFMSGLEKVSVHSSRTSVLRRLDKIR